MTNKQKEDKVEATGSKVKEILDNFKKGDNTRFPTMDELRAIFIKNNIHFTDEDFKNNSSGMINGKYKISPRNAAGAVNKYIRKPIIDYGFLYDSDNKDIQNAVISYINKNKLNVGNTGIYMNTFINSFNIIKMEKNELLNMVLVPDLVIEMLKGLSNKQYREFFEKYFNYYLYDIPFETNDMILKIIFDYANDIFNGSNNRVVS